MKKERFVLKLWKYLENIAEQTNIPWLVGGDFNMIANESENLGGLQVTQQETSDFVYCMSACSLNMIRYIGSIYTWWNERIAEDNIFKRLDRVLGNIKFMQLLSNSEVHHLIRQGSDHAPLQVICNDAQEQIMKPFKFLNFWTKDKEFKQVVEESWGIEVT